MIARTVVRVLLALTLVGWSVARIAPAAATERGVGLRLGVLLIVVGATAVAVRLFARRWWDAQTTRAHAFWGYAAPGWVQDASGLVLMLAGLCLYAWWA
jgi:hypothetical protein